MEQLEPGDRVFIGRSSPLGRAMGIIIKIEQSSAYHVLLKGFDELEPFTADELEKVTIVED